MDCLKVTCILLLPAATGVEAGMPEEVAVMGGETPAVGDRPVEAWEGPEKTGSLFRLTRTSTCTVWERISIQLPR